MAELSPTQTEVYVPRSLQLWRGLMNWLDFFFRLFIQMVKNTPLVSQFLTCLGLQHAPSSHSYKSLPHVELPLHHPPLKADDLANGSASGNHHTDKLTSTAEELANNNGSGDHYTDKLTVVLDLDETLVCAYETSSLPTIIKAQAVDAGLNWFEIECVSSEKECDGNSKINHVTVFERPGMREFLKQIGGFADLILFTAGLEDYARPLVDKIDEENLFSLRLYRPSTISTDYRDHVKDLSCLSMDLCRLVIVDNNPFSFLLQPLNGIPCISFSAGQPQDEQLLEVILPLLKHLSLQNDVRPVLYEKFHMPEWFQMHGIPASGLKV